MYSVNGLSSEKPTPTPDSPGEVTCRRCGFTFHPEILVDREFTQCPDCRKKVELNPAQIPAVKLALHLED